MDDVKVQLLRGDCRETLATLRSGSVQSCITSPPYYGLRDYGTPPLVWGGSSTCGAVMGHDWGAMLRSPWANDVPGPSTNHPKNGAASHWTPKASGQFCPCGAWLGSLGLEPTPELFIEHLVDVFRQVRRVLRDDGCLLVNMGDSMAGSGNGSNDHRQNGKHFRKGVDSISLNAEKYQGQKPGPISGLPAKNLMMMPARVAMALQADGWWLRSMMPWLKRSAMPESVTDRPASSVEYWFLLTKQARYFWDASAVRVPATYAGEQLGIVRGTKRRAYAMGVKPSGNEVPGADATINAGRNMRNGDLFFASWQGLLLDEDDAPMAMVVNPAGFKGSHFAVFPPKLVEPLIKATTSERGQCPECGAPWVRVTEGTKYEPEVVPVGVRNVDASRGDKVRKLSGADYNAQARSVTTGWRASCEHADLTPVPQTVLDCFFGSGTVGLVADRLGRNAIGCELSASYAEMGAERLVADSPMFTELSA